MEELTFWAYVCIAILLVLGFSGILIKLVKKDYTTYRIVKAEKKDICGVVTETYYYIDYRVKIFRWKWWESWHFTNESKDVVIAHYKHNTTTTDFTYIEEDICKL